MYIGVDIGGTKTLVAASSDGRRLGTSRKLATPAHPDEGLAAIKQLIHELSQGKTIQGIGLAVPGPLDFKISGTATHRRYTATGTTTPPNLHWQHTSLVKPLEREFKTAVRLDNDADAAALAEYQLGAGRNANPMLYVTISTGIGTGLIIDGQIFHGAGDTEGGHITLQPGGPVCGCGGRGHFEAIASGLAIKRRFGKFGYQIKDAHTWEVIAHDFAHGLANLAAITAPERIVLGGGVSVHFERFKKPLKRYFDQMASPLYPRPKIVVAKYVETAAIYGALLLAKQASSGNRS